MKKPHSTTGVIEQLPTTYARALAAAHMLEGLGVPAPAPVTSAKTPVHEMRDDHDKRPPLEGVA